MWIIEENVEENVDENKMKYRLSIKNMYKIQPLNVINNNNTIYMIKAE